MKKLYRENQALKAEIAALYRELEDAHNKQWKAEDDQRKEHNEHEEQGTFGEGFMYGITIAFVTVIIFGVFL